MLLFKGTCKRTAEMIRQKYDSLKKVARKKDAKNKLEEGKAEPDLVDMEDYEKELIRLLESHGGQNCEVAAAFTSEPSTFFCLKKFL